MNINRRNFVKLIGGASLAAPSLVAAATTGSIAVPPLAAAAGYNTLIFQDDSLVDLTLGMGLTVTNGMQDCGMIKFHHLAVSHNLAVF